MFQYYRAFGYYLIGVAIRKQLGKEYIYRIRNNVQERMLYYVPTNPRTYAQQFNRWKVKQAVLSWKGLNEDEKNYYRNKEPFTKTMSGYNYFISEYLKNI